MLALENHQRQAVSLASITSFFNCFYFRDPGTRGTLVTTGRLKPARCIFTPVSAQAPLELYTKGNGMVGMHFRLGRALFRCNRKHFHSYTLKYVN